MMRTSATPSTRGIVIAGASSGRASSGYFNFFRIGNLGQASPDSHDEGIWRWKMMEVPETGVCHMNDTSDHPFTGR